MLGFAIPRGKLPFIEIEHYEEVIKEQLRDLDENIKALHLELEQAEYLIKFIENEETIFIVGAAIIERQIFTYDGRVFGIENQKSLVLLTQSDGSLIIEEMVKNKLTDYFHTLLLEEFNCF